MNIFRYERRFGIVINGSLFNHLKSASFYRPRILLTPSVRTLAISGSTIMEIPRSLISSLNALRFSLGCYI